MSEYIFQLTTYITAQKSYELALDEINNLKTYSSVAYLANFVEEYHDDKTQYKILELKYYDTRMLASIYNDELSNTNRQLATDREQQIIMFDNPSNYREQEYEIIEDHDMELYVLIKNDLQFEAYLSLIKTTFILFIIMVSALLISKDATALVLQPLETIMLKVNEMAEDPFQILKFSEIEAQAEKDENKDGKVVYETMILDNAITKIGALLLLGFGEAGTSLLSDMMGKEGDIDTMASGK